MSNEVLFSCETFYISYLAQRSEHARILDDIVYLGRCLITERAQQPQELPETALCVKSGEEGLFDTTFYILYGDHREAYRGLIPSLPACLAYFNANIAQIAHSSDTPTTEGTIQ